MSRAQTTSIQLVLLVDQRVEFELDQVRLNVFGCWVDVNGLTKCSMIAVGYCDERKVQT